MEIIEGSIVRSIAGRDKGDLFIVLSREGDFVYLANGELRKVDHPKKKAQAPSGYKLCFGFCK